MFHGSCARYPFPDHNPPPMELILPCCQHIHSFLQKHDDNVVAVHCKAGKGRTGLMIVAYLMFGGNFRSCNTACCAIRICMLQSNRAEERAVAGLSLTALDARVFYDTIRTFDGKGLTIISQIRSLATPNFIYEASLGDELILV